MVKVITRNELYKQFEKEHRGYPKSLLIAIWNSLSDEELAKDTGLKVLRKGYFVPKF